MNRYTSILNESQRRGLANGRRSPTLAESESEGVSWDQRRLRGLCGMCKLYCFTTTSHSYRWQCRIPVGGRLSSTPSRSPFIRFNNCAHNLLSFVGGHLPIWRLKPAKHWPSHLMLAQACEVLFWKLMVVRALISGFIGDESESEEWKA